MTTDRLDAFMAAIQPTIEADLDQQIEAEPDLEARVMLRRYRSVLLSRALDATRIKNLEHRLAEAEARHLQLVPPGGSRMGEDTLRDRPAGGADRPR